MNLLETHGFNHITRWIKGVGSEFLHNRAWSFMLSFLSPGKHLRRLNIRRITIFYHHSPDLLLIFTLPSMLNSRKCATLCPFLPFSQSMHGSKAKYSKSFFFLLHWTRNRLLLKYLAKKERKRKNIVSLLFLLTFNHKHPLKK